MVARRPPFFRPVRIFNFVRHRVQHYDFSALDARQLSPQYHVWFGLLRHLVTLVYGILRSTRIGHGMVNRIALSLFLEVQVFGARGIEILTRRSRKTDGCTHTVA